VLALTVELALAALLAADDVVLEGAAELVAGEAAVDALTEAEAELELPDTAAWPPQAARRGKAAARALARNTVRRVTGARGCIDISFMSDASHAQYALTLVQVADGNDGSTGARHVNAACRATSDDE
jgi:hypothetical protein